MTVAENARQAAMNIEAKKHGLKQMQSGEWVLDLKVHANDMPVDLMAAPMGTRYVVALVEIGDDEEPIVQAEKPKGGRLAKKSGILRNEILFQRFMAYVSPGYWEESPGRDLENTSRALRDYCLVSSCSALDHDERAAELFEKLIGEYEGWKTL